MKRRDSGRRDVQVRAEINVTSLVDVAFTLLVIFIITAPVLQGGVEVDVPEGQVGTIEATDDLVIVSIQADETILFGETEVPRDGLEAALRQLIEAGDLQAVYVRADSMARYAPVFQVISVVAAQSGVALNLIGRELPDG